MVLASKAHTLYDDGHHKCYVFSELVRGSGIQANQFLILDGKHGATIDPGGDLTYAPLTLEIGKHMPVQNLDYIFASHQDPDIIASLGRWMMQTQAKVVVSKLWSRFLPHLGASYLNDLNGQKLEDRIIPIADKGSVIDLGDNPILILPGHFLHSVGNLHFYDVKSKILFSGDMGASLVDASPDQAVENFDEHIPSMQGFHERYMCSRKVCRLWADMVRELDVEMIVPQHGRPFKGKAMVNSFLDWISNLSCGVDLVGEENYMLTREHKAALKQ